MAARNCLLLCLLLLFLVFLASCRTPPPQARVTAEQRQVYQQLEAVFRDQLHRQILGFWLAHGIDRRHGGYQPWLDRAGNPDPAGNAPKSLVQQSRMIWTFSAAYALEARWEYPAAAWQGQKFFGEKFWDTKHGGWFWSVHVDGSPRERFKHLYGQSFAIYALAEYGRAFRDPRAIACAMQGFRLVEENAHDAGRRGYRERFTEDWQVEESNDPIGPPHTKSMNTHIHLLESFTTLYRATRDPTVRQRLEELLRLCTEIITTPEGYSVDFFDRDWNSIPGGTSYGHNVEVAWLMLDAADALFWHDRKAVEARALALVDHALRYGYDSQHGGFFYYGPKQGAATDLRKEWWTQAEALVGLLACYQITRDPKYWQAFEKTAEWCLKRQADPEYGEWYASLDPDGTVRDSIKASPWKAAYHNGRACIELIRRLRDLQRQQ